MIGSKDPKLRLDPMNAVPGGEFLTLAIALILAGSVTGLLAGLFGVGGGAMIVPILYQTFIVIGVDDALRMPLTVGTSLAVIIPTAVTSYLAHRKKGAVDEVALRLLAVPSVFSVVLGSALATIAPAALFRTVLATVSAAIGLSLLLGSQATRLRDDLPGPLPLQRLLIWLLRGWRTCRSLSLGLLSGGVNVLLG
jgi:uncharacterized protein